MLVLYRNRNSCWLPTKTLATFTMNSGLTTTVGEPLFFQVNQWPRAILLA